jgi:lysophospholipase L1-like esterase
VTRRFLALGDSYTIGEGVSASERWPEQLAAAVRAADVALADPVIVARTGWTTTELLAALQLQRPPVERDFDFVSLLIGVNDQYRGRGVEVFRAEFIQLISRAVAFATAGAAHVVVVSIPDWGVTPFASTDPRGSSAIASEIDRFNSVALEEARRAGSAFVDVTDISRRAAEDRTLLTADGLHPSAAMYAEWVKVILPVVLQRLEF